MYQAAQTTAFVLSRVPQLEELVRGQQRLEGHLNSSRRLMMVLLALLVALVVGVAMGGTRLLEQCSVTVVDGQTGAHDKLAYYGDEL